MADDHVRKLDVFQNLMNYAISLRFIGWCNLLVGKTHVTSRLFCAWCFA